uniref:Uncharacterized protein n=1 Tax=Zea mays TaxID=4577 RepID=A0A804U7R5_MAIZE
MDVVASSRNTVALAAPAAVPLEAHAQNPSIAVANPPSPEMEATAEALTQEEVLCRCRRRAVWLAGVYRRLYWAMVEEVHARHWQW